MLGRRRRQWTNIGTTCLVFAWEVALQSQKVVSAYLQSKQILPFGFAEQNAACKANSSNWLNLISSKQLIVFAVWTAVRMMRILVQVMIYRRLWSLSIYRNENTVLDLF